MKIVIKHRFTSSILYEADVKNLREVLIEAVKGGANLYGADLYGANLRGADLYGADLYGANLRGADLYGADLRGADLRGANLYGADLYGADLRGADLYGADLRGADLRGANLYGADLYGADLYGANLRGADLYGADLRGADLRGAKNYSESHDIFIEAVRTKIKISEAKSTEWEIIGKIAIHRPCWDTIKKFARKPMMRIFKRLADKGFGEFLEKYKQTIKD